VKSRARGAAWSVAGMIAASTLLVALVLALLYFLDGRRYVEQVFDWLARLGPWGPVFFILMDTAIVVLLLPGVVFTLGAGFLFGLVPGTLYVIIATTLGGVIAFTAGRYLFSDRLNRYLAGHPKLAALHREFRGRGLQVVLLSRMIPFFPFKLSNYLFGLGRFSLRDYTLGTVIGIIPITLTNVYLGSLAADLNSLLAGENVRSPLAWAGYGLGFAATVIGVVHLGRLARIRLDALSEAGEEAEGRP